MLKYSKGALFFEVKFIDCWKRSSQFDSGVLAVVAHLQQNDDVN